jgi:hypothetical protein
MITSTTVSSSKPAASEPKTAKPKAAANHRGPQGPRMNEASREARKMAAAILEVMGGARLPSDAAKALSISLPRYYLLESRALNGLLFACEPRRIGRVRSAESELTAARKEVQQLQQECARYSALVRAAQRTIGLSQPQPFKPGENGKGKRGRKRKPTVRALKAAELLINSASSGETEAVSGGDRPAEG